MDGNQENFEFVDRETGETFPLNGESLVSNVRDVLMSRRKQQTEATVWKSLSEEQQKDEITACQELARDLVGAVVNRVAEKGMTCANVEIGKFAVDVEKGVVTITAAGYASDEMLTDLAHSKGKVARITIVDAAQFNQKSTLLVPDPDQPSMLPDEVDLAPGENDHKGDADLYDLAVALVTNDRKCSTSYIQRKLAIGYNRAAGIVEKMEAAGVVSEANAVGKRKVLTPDPEQAAQLDDSDGLHDGNSAIYTGGFESRMAGYSRACNPLDMDENEGSDWMEWSAGWDAADQDEGAMAVDETLGVEPDGKDDEQVEQTTAPETEADPAEMGMNAALSGAGPDQCPFDGGTDEAIAWHESYTTAQGDIQTLKDEGYTARKDGQAPGRCKWKKDTPQHGLWMEGYTLAKGEETD